MTVPIIIGLLALALIVIFATGAFRRNGQSPAGMQSVVIILVLLVIVGLLVFRVIG